MALVDRSDDLRRGLASRAAPVALGSVVYRSRAVVALTDFDLYALVQAAQARNGREQITGLMLYDEGRFYQWLEGPAANVAALMRSITADHRHTDIEILSDKPMETRQFGDWTMRLATRGIRSIHSGNNVVIPSADTVANLRHNPAATPGLLAELASPESLPLLSNSTLAGPAGAILKDILVSAVLPDLLLRHTELERQNPFPVDNRARALADLLTGPDTEAAVELLRTLQDSEGAIRHLYENLLEPTARRLGDLWGDDLCAELNVTLGLAQLQRAVRVLNEEMIRPTLPKGLLLPAVLIVPEPGEAHMLGAVMDSDLLNEAGWEPVTAFPASDEALQDMIAGSWFDALDLSVSAAVRRDSWLPKVRQTIALARHASRNPALVVVVGGRIFAEEAGAGTAVGADAQSRTARQTARAIRDGISNRKG